MEVPSPARFLSFKGKFLFPKSYPSKGGLTAKGSPQPFQFLVLGLVLIQYFLLALFIGQLTPYPLFWGLLILFSLSFGLSLFQVLKGKNLHGWLWGILLSIFLLKVLFFPGSSFYSEDWLRNLGKGFQDLFSLGWGIFNSLRVGEIVSTGSNPAGALFLLLAIILWFPVGVSLDRAFRLNSGGWLLVVSLLILSWLEPTRTFPFFFPLFVLLLISLFFILWGNSRRERWRFLRFHNQSLDRKRVFHLSLLAFVPLLVFILPWALGNLVHIPQILPQIPSVQVEGTVPPTPHQIPPGGTAFPSLYLPPLTFPSWVETVGGYSSYIAILLMFLIGAFIYFRFGKRESLIYLVVALLLITLALWLLPPYLGPLLTRAFYYIKVGFNSFLTALGISRRSGLSGEPAGQGGEVLPESPNWMLEILRSLISFFSQTSVVLVSLAVILLGIGLVLVLKFGLRSPQKLKEREKGERPIFFREEISSPFSFYFKLLETLEEMGVKRRETETPWEFEDRAKRVLPFLREELENFTRFFVKARYGKTLPSPQENFILEKKLEGLREKIKGENGSQKA